MNRLLIERIEGRILVGIVMFVAIMILIGWVGINEPARMASFEQQHLGRSIERGAELFAANCSTCHGADGRGIAGRAPGLNNPHLFGYNYLAEVNNEIARRERQANDLQVQISELNAEREALFAEIASGPTQERQAEIVARISEIDDLVNPDVEGSIPARIETFQEELVPLREERETQLAQLEDARFANYLPGLDAARARAEEQNSPIIVTNYITDSTSRLGQAGWGGDLRGYITTTLVHGRPGSQYIWGAGNQMVAWAQTGGGPLRGDQIDDIVNYILNWDQGDDWSTEDLFAVNQFARVPADSALVTAGGDGPEAVGTDVEEILAAFEEITPDAARGELLYNGQERAQAQPVVLGCSGCHLGGAQAPDTVMTWDNTVNIRLDEAQFAGYTPEQYLIESIVNPNAYVVPPYASGVMPQNYNEQLSVQDVADIIAYLRTYSSE